MADVDRGCGVSGEGWPAGVGGLAMERLRLGDELRERWLRQVAGDTDSGSR